LIIVRPHGTEIPKDYIEEGMKYNSHGAGFAVQMADGNILVSKGYFSLDALVGDLAEFNGLPAIVHQRIATAGKVSGINCHPFAVGEIDWMSDDGMEFVTGAAVAHNGILSYGSATELKEFSDTYLLVRDVLAPLYRSNEVDMFNKALEAYADVSRSRFAMVDKYGLRMYGDGWVKEGEIWYSNRSYLPYVPVQYVSRYGGSDYTGYGSRHRGSRRTYGIYGEDDDYAYPDDDIVGELMTCEICDAKILRAIETKYGLMCAECARVTLDDGDYEDGLSEIRVGKDGNVVTTSVVLSDEDLDDRETHRLGQLALLEKGKDKENSDVPKES